MSSYDAVLDFPPCRIGARFTGEALTGLNYLPLDTPLTRHPDQRAKHLANELEHYAHHPQHLFDLLFVPGGTPFQLRVWRALLAIPAGQTLSYGDLAKQLQTAPRAVGQACGSNPLPLVIPCHRVVSTTGLGGFMHAAEGAPLDIKAWLLRHERGDFVHGLAPSPLPPSPRERGLKRCAFEVNSESTPASGSLQKMTSYSTVYPRSAEQSPLPLGEG